LRIRRITDRLRRHLVYTIAVRWRAELHALGSIRGVQEPRLPYEDLTVAGSTSVSGMKSCWLGFQRDYFGKGLTVTNNAMADPDAIEVGNNLVNGNLSCAGNTNSVPASAAVWDTSDVSPGALYPRKYKPNIVVHGTRSGQCNSSTPTTAGGPSGAPGSF
jgi:hypothetical protein